MVLVMALGWWGMVTLGNFTLAAQSDSLTAQQDPTTWLGVRCLLRWRRVRREEVLARAGAVLTEASLTHSPHVSREWD